MASIGPKQPALKPQDLVVAMKVAVSTELGATFSSLGRELHMSASEVHAAVKRCIVSHLVDREDGAFNVNRASLHEFLLHGVRYAFPAVVGPVMRGVPTGVSAEPLIGRFEHAESLPLIWPDPEGEIRGISLCPLYPSVPTACRLDPQLYRALALVDALRGGAARERELAGELIMDFIR